MGCGASTASAVTKPAARTPSEEKNKKRDVQTTYRERLGEDFMKDFARSQEAIRDRLAPRSPGSSAASAASTEGEEGGISKCGTLISPYHLPHYTTPPKDTMPEAPAGAENPAAEAACAAPGDASGPYISSNAKTGARLGAALHLVTRPAASAPGSGSGRGSLSRAGSSGSEESEGQRRAERLRPVSQAGPHLPPPRLQPLTGRLPDAGATMRRTQ
jgi:hypothetical protein